MDELLIEDKKYVSSKQAAKVTGYAKDYIGQLCREGRVPARLVGRSWYVLESAIHDHRFAEQKAGSKEKTKRPASPARQSAWESPRYEASTAETLPVINPSEEDSGEESPAQEDVDENALAQNLQDSWKAWFERVAEARPSIPDVIPEKRKEEPVIEEKEEEEADKGEVNVPIHAVYREPPEELLPQRGGAVEYQEEEDEEPLQEKQGHKRGSLVVLRLAGAMLAVIMVGLAVLGSGYFDTYITSHTRVGFIAGVGFYNK